MSITFGSVRFNNLSGPFHGLRYHRSIVRCFLRFPERFVRIFKLLKTLILTAGLLLPALAHADDWLPPNPQELSMTA